MLAVPKSGKLLNYLNHKMKITINDGRWFIGKFMAYDKHMNVVLGDAEEYRRIVPKKKKNNDSSSNNNNNNNNNKLDDNNKDAEKRTIGLMILRGESIVSMTVVGAPPAEERAKQPDAILPGSVVKGIGRGSVTVVSQAAPGLAAPARGVGGPVMNMMPMAPSIPTSAGVIGGNLPPPGLGMMPPGMGMMPPGILSQQQPPQFFNSQFPPPGQFPMMGRGMPPMPGMLGMPPMPMPPMGVPRGPMFPPPPGLGRGFPPSANSNNNTQQ